MDIQDKLEEIGISTDGGGRLYNELIIKDPDDILYDAPPTFTVTETWELGHIYMCAINHYN